MCATLSQASGADEPRRAKLWVQYTTRILVNCTDSYIYHPLLRPQCRAGAGGRSARWALGAPYAARRPRRACWRSEHRSERPGSMRHRGAALRVRASAIFAPHTRQHTLAGDRRELVCVCTSTLSLTTRRRTSDSQRAESRRAARGQLRTAAAPRSRPLGPMF